MKLTKIKKLVKNLHITPGADMYEKTLRDTLRARENFKKRASIVYKPNMWRIIAASRTGGLVAAFLIISFLIIIFVQSREVTKMRHELESIKRDTAIDLTDYSATINFYSKEHQDVVAQHASLKQVQGQSLQIHVSQQDILYYELLDGQPAYTRPGIIVRGPSSRQETDASQMPIISNGHTLSLTEARETANFDLVAPSWFNPGYTLDQIRRVDGRDVLHMLYTDGINTLSLFEQPLDGQRGLSPQDIREYAIFLNKGQTGGTILAWRDAIRSYVLIGNIEISQLMNIAQSVSAEKVRK